MAACSLFRQRRAARSWWQRKAPALTVLIVLAMAAVASLAGATLMPASSAGGAGTVPFGVYVGAADPGGVASFASATGTHPTYASDYLPWQSGWAAMSDPSDLAWMLGPWSSSPYTLVLGVPMIPEDASGAAQGTLAGGAAGDYDSYFATLAQTLVSGGEAHAVLRIGWEFNGDWFPWAVTDATDAANYVTYFDRIVTTMRSVPGQDFSFAWNPNNLGSYGSAYTPDQTYPGDAYVDYVGTDVYDQCWCTPQDPQTAWAAQLQGTWGLDWLSTFAAAHDKPIAIPEWGVAVRSDGHGLGDDPYFVSQFASWITQNDVAFTSYFDFDSPGQSDDILDGQFPDALAAFQTAFTTTGAGSTSPAPAPTTTSPGAPTTTVPPTTLPSTTIPPTTVPPTTVPPTTAPSTTAPSTTAPSTTVPATNVAPTTVPPTTVPATAPGATSGTPAAQTTPTAITFTVDPDTSDTAQVLTWTVTPNPGGGSLSFSIDGWTGDLPVSTTTGTVSLGLFLTPGPHGMEAAYSGDDTFAPSSVSTSFTSGTTLSELDVSEPVQIGVDNRFLVAAALTSGGVPVAGAQVWFETDRTELCQAATGADGVASCTVDEGSSDRFDLATGSVTAIFGGDARHAPAEGDSPVTATVTEDDTTHIRWSGAGDPPDPGLSPLSVSAVASRRGGADSWHPSAPVVDGAPTSGPTAEPGSPVGYPSPWTAAVPLGAGQGTTIQAIAAFPRGHSLPTGAGTRLLGPFGFVGLLGLVITLAALVVRRRLRPMAHPAARR